MLQQISPKQLFIGILIFSIIPTMGLVVSLYTQAWDPLWNPFRPAPEKVLETMTQKFGEVETVHGKIDFGLEVEIRAKQNYKISGIIEGDNATTDYKNPRSTANFNIAFSAEGMQFSFAAESILAGKESYLKITTIPAIPILSPILTMAGIDLEGLKNQWLKIDEESLKEITGEDEQLQDREKQERLLSRLRALLVGKKFFRIQQELGDEKIGEKMVYHYLVILDKEEIKKMVPDLLKIGLEEQAEFQKLSGTDKETLGEALKEFPEEFDEFLEKIGDITAEVWIGKKDKLLYRIKAEKEIDLSKFATDEEGKGFIKININADFSNYNQPVKIEAPKDYKTLKEVLAPLIEKQKEMLKWKEEMFSEEEEPELKDETCWTVPAIPKANVWLNKGGSQYLLNKENKDVFSLFNEDDASGSSDFIREYTYKGVLFDAGPKTKSGYRGRLNLNYNKEAKLPVGMKAEYIYGFAMGNTGNVYLGTGEYADETNVVLTISYTDGSCKQVSAVLPWDWSSGRDYSGKNATTIYLKDALVGDRARHLYAVKFTNPEPDKTIDFITIRDDFTKDYPITNIFALTLSDIDVEAEHNITILSPNGGENWSPGNTYNITWKSTGVEEVQIQVIDYSYSSEFAKTITEKIPADKGIYSWRIPESIITPSWKPGDNYKIAIFETNSEVYDESDNYFKLVNP